MSAFAWLGALREFDLDLLRGDQVFTGDAEAAGRDLLDRAVSLCLEPVAEFAALTGVGFCAEAVHRHSHAFVGLSGERTVGHGACLEALDDLGRGLHFLERDALFGVLEGQQAPQGVWHVLVVDHGGIGFEALVVAVLNGSAQVDDGTGVVEVVLFPGAAAQFMVAHAVDGRVSAEAQRVICVVMPVLDALRDLRKADAADTAHGVGEIFLDDVFPDAHDLEDLRGLVGLDGRDAHLGGDLHDAVQHRFVVVVDRRVGVLVEEALLDTLFDALMGQVRVDRPGAVPEEGREVVDTAGLRTLEDDGDGGPLLRADEVLLHRRDSQQRRDGHVVLVDAAVRQDDDVRTLLVSLVALHVEVVDGLLEGRVLVVQDADRCHFEARQIHVFDFQQVDAREDGMPNFQDLAVVLLVLEQVTVRADIDLSVRDDPFPDGVDGRVRDLREQLLEVAEQELVLLGQDRERDVDAHGGDGFRAVLSHRKNGRIDVLIGVTKDLVEPVTLLLGGLLHLLVRNGQFVERFEVHVEPFSIGVAMCVPFFALIVRDDAPFPGIDQEHFAGLQPGLLHDMAVVRRQDPDFRGQDEQVIIGHIVPGRPQTVAVEAGADLVAVREQDRGGTVPGLHHRGVVVVHVLLLAAHGVVGLPGFRDADHHGEGQVHAVHDEELESVVQHGGIGPGGVDHRQDLLVVLGEERRLHGLAPGEHAVRVAADGVDLTVVDDEPVRVCPFPAGVRVGGEPGMDHGDVRNEVLFLEVFVKASQLMYEEHAFINDGPGGQRADVCVVVGLFEDPADHIEFAVEVDAGLAVLRFFDETLLDEGHLVDRFLPESLGTGRDFTPAEELEALFGGDDLEHLLRLGTAQFVLRQEEHADAVFPFIAKCDAALSGFLFEERVGRCYDDADAVTGLPGRVFARAVLQLLDDLQRAVDDAAGRDALDGDDGPDAAGIVFELLSVKQIVLQSFIFHNGCSLLTELETETKKATERRIFCVL